LVDDDDNFVLAVVEGDEVSDAEVLWGEVLHVDYFNYTQFREVVRIGCDVVWWRHTAEKCAQHYSPL
jgi:hypothetical protein